MGRVSTGVQLESFFVSVIILASRYAVGRMVVENEGLKIFNIRNQ
jgi:hypothetical protein